MRRLGRSVRILSVLLLSTGASLIYAIPVATMRSSGVPIPALFVEMAEFCDLPPKVLYAVARVESGR
jgi:hypothetical protein